MGRSQEGGRLAGRQGSTLGRSVSTTEGIKTCVRVYCGKRGLDVRREHDQRAYMLHGET